MRHVPTDPAERRVWLAGLEVEHDHVHPDDIPGYWDQLARENRARRAKAARGDAA